jgi:hypothetical protein
VDLRPTVFVVLLFPEYRPDMRWVDEVPRVGSRITDGFGQSWRVAEVVRSGIHTYTVVCEQPTHRLANVTDLAGDLLERARKAISPTERKRKRLYP